LNKVAEKMNLSSGTHPDEMNRSQLSKWENDGKNYLYIAPNKSESRAAEKVHKEYDGDWSKLKDMVRATIVVDDMKAMGTLPAALS